MRIGVLLLPTDPWARSVARARELERLGFAHLWTYDHLSWQRYRDSTWFGTVPWLTGLATATSRIRLGTMVSSPNFRHPVTFAKDVLTMDHISGGRVTIGVGAGGTGFDATVLGQPSLTPGERAARMADFVETLDGLLRHASFSSRGGRYPVLEARMIPGCLQQPRVPLAIAAGGPRTLGIAARFGDAWITEGDPGGSTPATTDEFVRAQSRELDRRCVALGRDPASLDRIFLISNRIERPLRSVGAFREFLERCQALGFTDVVFHDPRADDPIWDDDPAVVEAIATEFPGPQSPA